MSRVETLSRPRTWAARRVDIHDRSDVRYHLRDALWLLLQAYDYAAELQQDVWSFAVELNVLRAAHLTTSDMRWLACKGYVDHACETTKPDDEMRRFRRNGAAIFPPETCMVLTPAGVEMARDICGTPMVLSAQPPEVSVCIPPAFEALQTVPKWDRDRRQLRFDGQIVKEFKLPSPNQEAVLVAFEEEGWPARIDDPLSPVPEVDPRRRLHDTIKALNRKQKHPLLRFMGDGSGEGIRWEPASGRVEE